MVSGRVTGGQTLKFKSLHYDTWVQQSPPQNSSYFEAAVEGWARLCQPHQRAWEVTHPEVNQTAGGKGKFSPGVEVSREGHHPGAWRLAAFLWAGKTMWKRKLGSFPVKRTNKNVGLSQTQTLVFMTVSLNKFSMGFIFNLTEFQHYDKLVSKTWMRLICQIYVFFREKYSE